MKSEGALWRKKGRQQEGERWVGQGSRGGRKGREQYVKIP